MLPHFRILHKKTRSSCSATFVVDRARHNILPYTLPDPWHISICVPTGRDAFYGVGHCFTCVGDLCFDSTLPRAFKVSVESLDWSVGGTYECMNEVCELCPRSTVMRLMKTVTPNFECIPFPPRLRLLTRGECGYWAVLHEQEERG